MLMFNIQLFFAFILLCFICCYIDCFGTEIFMSKIKSMKSLSCQTTTKKLFLLRNSSGSAERLVMSLGTEELVVQKNVMS